MTEPVTKRVQVFSDPRTQQARRRWDIHGPISPLAEIDGYMWVRRPGCNPFTMTTKNWERLTTQKAHAGKAGLVVKWGVPEETFMSRRHDDPKPTPTNEISYVARAPRAAQDKPEGSSSP